MSKHELKLTKVLKNDMRFDEYKGPLIHKIHGFAAKFPPELPRYFIKKLTEPGDVVLDPMVGSGTTIIESMLLNRKGVGVDIGPLSLLQSKVKSTICDPTLLLTYAKNISNDVTVKMMEKGYPKKEDDLDEYLKDYDADTIKFFSYWFLPKTSAELSLLVKRIAEVDSIPIQNALKIAFSSIIIRKSAGVSLARDLTHTRPHRDLDKKPDKVIPSFVKAVENITDAYRELEKIIDCPPVPTIIEGDAKSLSIKNESVKLIVTSPPYANALDYMRAHKFSLSWLGYRIKTLSSLRGKFIGSERQGESINVGLKSIDSSLERISKVDNRRAKIIAKYFKEMDSSIKEMRRVLECGGCVVIVVGPSTSRGNKILTHQGLAEIAMNEGLSLIGMKQRGISRDRRHLPFSNNSDRKGIEKRIHEEYVILLSKL